ncbi:MAG: hypothetical protein ABJA86_06715 [Nocardioidaceae bacterium]
MISTEKAPGRRRWALAAAVAAVAIVGVGGYAALGDGQDDVQPPTSADAQPIRLGVASPGTSMGSCIQFSVDILADMPVAFSGTVVDVGKGTVLLDVDHWYRGGDSKQVELTSPDPSMVALDGGVTFGESKRYLVTAAHGVVNPCGYTTEWNAETAAAFHQAFER